MTDFMLKFCLCRKHTRVYVFVISHFHTRKSGNRFLSTIEVQVLYCRPPQNSNLMPPPFVCVVFIGILQPSIRERLSHSIPCLATLAWQQEIKWSADLNWMLKRYDDKPNLTSSILSSFQPNYSSHNFALAIQAKRTASKQNNPQLNSNQSIQSWLRLAATPYPWPF